MPDVAKDLSRKITSEMDSNERYKVILEEIKDKDMAREINKLFEASVLLKKQSLAEKRFFDKITDSEWKKDRLKYAQTERARKKELMYNEDGTIKDNFKALIKETDQEIEDSATSMFHKKYKVDLSESQVKELVALRSKSQELSDVAQGTPSGSAERLAYGKSLVELQKYMKYLIEPTEKMELSQLKSHVWGNIKDRYFDINKATDERKWKGISRSVGETIKLAYDAITTPVYKSIEAALDYSGMFRQGFKTLTTGLMQGDKIWKQNVIDGFKPILKLGSQKEQQELADLFQARIFGDPFYEEMQKAGLRIGGVEDFFPTSIAEKIPVLGNAFKASNEAFTILVQGMRFDLYKKLRGNLVTTYADRIKGMTEEQISKELKKELKDITEVANSITGSGSLGKLESASGLINKLLFSGRFIRSQADTFLMPFRSDLDPVARKAAMDTSKATFGAIGALMLTAGSIGEVEFDPRSSKFGKVKLPGSKDTWIDLTAGLGGYISVLAKELSGQSKSSISGKITELGKKYGSPTRFDVAVNWLAGKAAPGPSQAIQILKGKTYSGEKPTITSTATGLVTPIGISNAYDVFTNEDLATALMALLADSVGASASNYEKFK